MTPIDRRAALGAIAGASAVFAVAGGAGANSDTLSALIAAHRNARAAFCIAVDELESAEPADDAFVIGIGGGDYALRNGEDRIAGWIDDHFERLCAAARTISRTSPEVGRDALAVLKRERDAARARLTEAFAKTNAAELRRKALSNAEENALTAVCAYRCTSGELEQKFRYLWDFRDELSEEQTEAIFASFLPAAEA